MEFVENAPTDQEMHKLCMILTSKDIKSLKRVCSKMIANIQKRNLGVQGTVRMKNNILIITTKKRQGGEDPRTRDRFQLDIQNGVIYSKENQIRDNPEPGVIAKANIARE